MKLWKKIKALFFCVLIVLNSILIAHAYLPEVIHDNTLSIESVPSHFQDVVHEHTNKNEHSRGTTNEHHHHSHSCSSYQNFTIQSNRVNIGKNITVLKKNDFERAYLDFLIQQKVNNVREEYYYSNNLQIHELCLENQFSINSIGMRAPPIV